MRWIVDACYLLAAIVLAPLLLYRATVIQAVLQALAFSAGITLPLLVFGWGIQSGGWLRQRQEMLERAGTIALAAAGAYLAWEGLALLA